MKKVLVATLFMFGAAFVNAQDITVEEIIENYIEAIGGREAWEKLEGLRVVAKVDFNGFEMPIETINLKDGRVYSVSSINGKKTVNNAFDGEINWSHNSHGKPLKNTEDAKNAKRSLGMFPDPLLTYDEMGYDLELVGESKIDKQECYKLKMLGFKKLVNNKDYDVGLVFYISKETFLLVGSESKNVEDGVWGKDILTIVSDYKPVDGLLYSFKSKTIHPEAGTIITYINEVELNPEVDDNLFMYPGK